MAGSLIGAATSAVAGKALNGIFGGDSEGAANAGPSFPAISTAGFDTDLTDEGKFSVTTSKARQKLLDEKKGIFFDKSKLYRDAAPKYAGLYGDASEDLQGLLSQVAPGYGRLTESRVKAVRDAGERNKSNLTQNLSNRKLLGSSFASNDITSSELEFSKAEEQARAESFLQEMEMTHSLLNEKLQVDLSGVQTDLDLYTTALETDMQALNVPLEEQERLMDIAVSLANGVAQAMNDSTNRQLEHENGKAAGAGAIFGEALGGVSKKVGNIANDFIGGLF